MGERGPPKKPSVLKMLNGNASGRKILENEPKPKIPEDGFVPECLRSEAKAIWLSLSARLRDCGLLTVVDRELLTRYCADFADWLDVRFELDRMDSKYYEKTSARGGSSLQIHPLFVIEKRISEALLRCEKMFGMAPAARAGLEVEFGASEPDELDRILAGD